jgi:hypothetical protein
MAVFLTALALVTTSCSDHDALEKGFPVSASDEHGDKDGTKGLSRDSLIFPTRPSNVLLTGIPNIRLTTVYKVNYSKKDSSSFIGSNNYHYDHDREEYAHSNRWNGHIIPGFEAVYGYNLVSISHYDIATNEQKPFFARPVLIKTLYYPSFSSDTLNNAPVSRVYFMVTAYDEDTNKDGYIDIKDLRRMHLFNRNGERLGHLVPANYSVFKSEYDSGNDLLFVFAQLDANGNGSRDEQEPIHIHWVDLKDPARTGRQY